MKYLSIIALIGLVACGADGVPERPGAKSGVAVNGDVAVGVTVK